MADLPGRTASCLHCAEAIQQVTAGNGYTYWSHVVAGSACGGKWKAGSTLAEPDLPGRVPSRWLCRLLRRHRGSVGYVAGPFWMCDSCGTVLR